VDAFRPRRQFVHVDGSDAGVEVDRVALPARPTGDRGKRLIEDRFDQPELLRDLMLAFPHQSQGDGGLGEAASYRTGDTRSARSPPSGGKAMKSVER
jgi:hypothetical protein